MVARETFSIDLVTLPARDKWRSSGFFALRTPLLPIDTLARLEGSSGAEGALRELVRSDPAVREALFVASPSLHAAIDAWLADPNDPRAHGTGAIVLRYVARMSARPTPFGLFSGCSVGTIGAVTRLELAPRASYRRHSRLDMHYLDALCEALLSDREIRHALVVRPSTGAYATATHWRIAESHADRETRARTYRLVSIERTPYLDATLARAAGGATVEALARALVVDDPEIGFEEALGFVDEIVAAQLLVSDLAPAVTGGEALSRLIATLRSAAPGRASADALDEASRHLRALDESGVAQPVSRYLDIVRALEPLPARPDLARLVQVDLYKPVAHAQLGARVVREIERAIEVLARISSRAENDELRRFREAFVERYETREVPLAMALDEELGIGFASGSGSSGEPSPMLEGLPFDAPAANPRAEIGPRERRLARGLDAALRAGAIEWSLAPDDLEALAAKTPAPLPDAFAFFGVVAAESADAADRGELRVHAHGIAGPSGAPLLGRFCHGDAELRAHVEAHLRAEESLRPDAIFAEVVHLPEGRLGNILGRPTLRAHEIAYLGVGGADDAHRIGIDDLLVAVRGERIVLRSKRLGREIVPRMTTAHNFSGAALGIYRFLCALQALDGASVRFTWGPFEGAPFLPRVRAGSAVLSPATWTLSKADLAPLARGAAAERVDAAAKLRERTHLPRWVGLRDGDNVLPVDLAHPLHLDSLAQLVKSRDVATLVELAISPEETCALGPEGRFAHEIVVPFVRDAEPARASAALDVADANVVRSFIPGSEWLYAKIYTGTAAADAVLRDAIAPLARARKHASWFFIRYNDPRWHLRVRFRGDAARLTAEILPALHTALAPMIADGRVWRVQLDTYEREVERYGGPRGIELAEDVFAADSDAALAIVAALTQDDGNARRGDLALYGTHALLCDLGLDLVARLSLVRGLREAFAREHQVTGDFEKKIGMKFRERRRALEAVVAGEIGDDARAAFAARSERVSAIAAKLAEANVSVVDLAGSLVHMHVNRLLRADHRAQELVIYDLLERIYDAQHARSRKR
jgi:thiopeptide-type bacteriocin biosynthesis protein